jgi:peptidoglycan/LPS O-acetylase OafA/YrhL
MPTQPTHSDPTKAPPNAKADHFAGFDGIRLVAAIAVILSHAFVIAGGTDENGLVVQLLGGRKVLGVLGDYGVATFFIISGFLLSRSLRFNPSILTYAVNRTLRIVPAFAACALVTAFVIGPICTTVPWGTYFSSSTTWSFPVHSVNLFTDWVLPGVFGYDGELAKQVNGSLWSLRYEALSYVFLLLVWTTCRSATLATWVVVAVAIGTWTSPFVTAHVLGIAFTLPYFAGGVLMQWVHARYGTNRAGAVASAVLLVVAGGFHLQTQAFAVLGAYLVVFFGERQNPGSKLAGKIGDCSYGLYLYGWPVEQLLRQLTGTTDPMFLFVTALALTWTLAFLSCHFIERPAMKHRRALASRIRAVAGKCFGGALAPATGGAKIAFVAGAAFLLTAGHWWLVIQSIGELALVMLAGAVLAVLVHRIGLMSRLFRPGSDSSGG